MPYSINKYNGQVLTVVEDGTIDNTLDIKLVGKNYAGYGEIQNENFVHLLENFSSGTQPPRPTSGQIWYDSSNKKLKFWDGTKFRTTGGAEISATAPTGLTTGDFWFDTVNNQLYAWSGSEFVLVGPQGVSGLGVTQMRARSVLDNTGASHGIIEGVVDDDTIFIISADEFTLDNATNPITGYSLIKKGLTLIYSSTGITTTDHVFWGTSNAAKGLVVGGTFVSASNFVQAGTASFSTTVEFSDNGYIVGNDSDLKVSIVGGNEPVITNQVGDTITFKTTSGVTTYTPMKLVANTIVPGADNTTNIGSTSYKYATMYATSFNGTATQADSLNVGGSYRTASTSAGVNTVAARDASGNLTANVFQGVATSARFADLAEKYLADQEYETGTVIMVGGESEVTAATEGSRPIGVVSANPAYMMNSGLEGGTYIALKGRVPVKIYGSVNKGDKLTVYANGWAKADNSVCETFAIALETNHEAGVKLVEAVIL